MIWAAVDILEGRCVQLRGGDPQTARYLQDPVEAMQRWADEGADGLHLIDLDAALGKGENRSVLKKMIRTVRVPVQVGGGVRDTETVDRWLSFGAERVIVGTKGVREPDWLREITMRFPKKIVLAVDARGDEVTIAGWTQRSGKKLLDVARSVDDFGLAALLYTNVGVEGLLQGIDPKPIRQLCESVRTPVLISGGLRHADDVRLAYQLGAAGVVLGTALYAGTVHLAELRV
ncbi:1-(5-phosphoribosyl)-5-[(5-phosphoribosylamino)methylideneamino]imidazole-4-carboxamide isomerase [Candidatus Acetothermia bacterium]|nr:1-(5-phosphoribosyl)-5-[(5-phosphoribosylamino)methylideneamino]imidazole-4-carboxamide isomerase [Candidatus Acetothermia bacterium]